MNRPNLLAGKGEGFFGARTLLMLVLLITLATMGRAAMHEFVDWDDKVLLADNPKFNPPGWSSVAGYILPRNADESLYIPATQIAWGIVAAIGHTDHGDAGGSLLNPWVFHSANLASHLASVVIVFAILRRLYSDTAAWIGAVVFAIHPVQVETIAWASGFRDLLSGLFGFICLIQLMEYRRTDRRSSWIFATIMAALAMLAKPSAVALPIEAVVLDVLILRTNFRRSLAGTWPWFVLGIPIVLITHHVQPMVWPTGVSFPQRPLIALDSIAFYISKIIAPVHLVFDYGRTPRAVLADGVRLIWLLPVFLWLLIIWTHNRLPNLTAGCVLAAAGVVPVLGLVPFIAQDYSTVSDHYLYPSMLGVAIVAASIFEASLGRLGRAATYGVASVAIAAMALQSFALVDVWSNSFSLFSYALRVNPRSSNANAGLAFSLSAAGDSAGAMEHFQRAERLNPHNGMAIMGLANLLLHNGDLDAAATQYERLMKVYQMQPNFDPKLGAAGELVISARLMQRGDTAGAMAALEQARQWDPSNPRIAEAISRIGTPIHPAQGEHAAP